MNPGARRRKSLRHRYAEVRSMLLARLIRRLGDRTGRARLHRPTRLVKLPGPSVLSLSPHPDDDVLAVGGTLHLHVQAGHRVTSLVLTDGARGDLGDPAEGDLPAMRREEARAAAARLGLEVRFAGEPDGALEPERAAGHIRQLVEELRPDVIYLPFPIDYHRDHLAVAAALCRVLRESDTQPALHAYECVAPMIPNRLVEISQVVEVKKEAIRCFASQMAAVDYVRTIPEGLNRFRSFSLLAGRGYAEALFRTDAVFLRRLLRVLGEPG